MGFGPGLEDASRDCIHKKTRRIPPKAATRREPSLEPLHEFGRKMTKYDISIFSRHGSEGHNRK
jgi:hypothetical protein